MKKLYLLVVCAVVFQSNLWAQLCPTSVFTSTAPKCVNSDVDFTYTGVNGTGGASGITYEWDFGDGSTPRTSSARNPSGIKYLSSGTKTITLIVRWENSNGGIGGCGGGTGATTNTQNITIYVTPTTSFSSTAPQCTGVGVDFTNTGTSSAVTYDWNFDALGATATPATSTTANQAGVTYSSAGSKKVKLTLTGTGAGACVVSDSQIVQINATPVVSFTSSATNFCANEPVNFTNTSNNTTVQDSLTYSWDFGADATPRNSTAQNPQGILYSSSGTKSISLQITTARGCSSTATNSVIINATPTSSFTSTAPQCTGVGVDFTNTGTTGATYAWNFGGAVTNTSSSQNPTAVVYNTEGSKIVKLTITQGACVVTDSQTININKTPNVIFTSTADAPGGRCVATLVNFTNTANNATQQDSLSYSWDFGVEATPRFSTAKSPAGISYISSGTKNVTFQITSARGCANTVVQPITIYTTPTASFTSTAPQCTGLPVYFTNTGTSTNVTYAWDFGSGATPATSTTVTPSGVTTTTYSTSGSKIVRLTLTSTLAGACAVTATQTININQTPTVSFTSTAPKCVGSIVDFTNTGSTGFEFSYLWDLGSEATPKLSTAESPKGISYLSSGKKYITLEVTSTNGCSRLLKDSLTILATPVVGFTSTAPQCTFLAVDFTNTNIENGVNYSWDFDYTGASSAAPLTSTAISPSGVVYRTAGSKIIRLTATNFATSCAISLQHTININQRPTATFTSNAPKCIGQDVDFSSAGSSTINTKNNWLYSWDFGADATPKTSSSENPKGIVYATSGTKTVRFTVSNGICSKDTTNSVVSINALPVANAGSDTTICANTSVVIGSASIGGNSYKWFPTSTLKLNPVVTAAGTPTASPVSPITPYVVTVTNIATGCINIDTINVTMLAPIKADAGTDVVICRYDAAALPARTLGYDEVQVGAALIEGQIYKWTPSKGILTSTVTSNTYVSPDSTTTYTLTVTGSILKSNQVCGPELDYVTVTVHQLPIANAGTDDTITVGASKQLIATGGLQYNWRPSYGLDNIGINTPIANPEYTMDYIVRVTDVYGCIKEDTMLLTVIQPSVWVPNAFTPNGDGKSDEFIVRGEGLKDFEFGVFNRWGEQVFYTKTMGTGWDGTRPVTGEQLPAGAYVYYFKGIKTDGEVVNKKGMINLIR